MQIAKRRKPVEQVIRGLNSLDIAKVESLDFGKANRSIKKYLSVTLIGMSLNILRNFFGSFCKLAE